MILEVATFTFAQDIEDESFAIAKEKQMLDLEITDSIVGGQISGSNLLNQGTQFGGDFVESLFHVEQAGGRDCHREDNLQEEDHHNEEDAPE